VHVWLMEVPSAGSARARPARIDPGSPPAPARTGPGLAPGTAPAGPGEVLHHLLPPEEWPSLLSEAELVWSQRRRSVEERLAFIAGRALLRQVLAQALGCEARAVALVEEDDRPRLSDPGIGLHVSQAQGGSLVACALGRRPVGIDIQAPSVAPFDPALAAKTCSPPEQWVLSQLPAEERALAWRRIWVRKAAVDQAMSPGLRLAPSSLTVGMGGTRIRGVGPRSRSWRLEPLPLGEGYLGAVAARGRAWRLQVHRAEPRGSPDPRPLIRAPRS
jgi:4'-phosphopantetheinyl transferase